MIYKIYKLIKIIINKKIYNSPKTQASGDGPKRLAPTPLST